MRSKQIVCIILLFCFLYYRLKEQIEAHPDDWHRRGNPRQWRQSLQAVCEFIGSRLQDTVLVENATTGPLYIQFANHCVHLCFITVLAHTNLSISFAQIIQ